MIQDLQKLLGVYRELKGRLRESSIEKTNDYLIVNSDLGLFEKVEDAEQQMKDAFKFREATIGDIAKITRK